MSHFRRIRIPLAAVVAFLMVAGFAAATTGVYLWFGVAPALVVGGVVVMAAGALVDLG